MSSFWKDKDVQRPATFNNFDYSPQMRISSSKKKQSILKKSSGRNTPTKNVKFNNTVNVNQFYSSPNEKFHEIMINSPDRDEKNEVNLTFEDEILWNNTKNAMESKEDILDQEIQRMDQEILRITKENNEILELIEIEKKELMKEGYKNIHDKEIDQLVLQNRSLQELVNEKIRENEGLSKKLSDVENYNQSPNHLYDKINDLEKENYFLESQINLIKTKYENEMKDFKFVMPNIFDDPNQLKSLENEIEMKENEIWKASKHLETLDKLLYIEKNPEKLSMEDIFLICVEFERLKQILEQKKEDNFIIENKFRLYSN